MTISDPTLAALAPVVQRWIPTLLDDVEHALNQQWPEYAVFLRENRDEVTRTAEQAMIELVTLADGGRDGIETALFEEIGRAQCRDGHDLVHLLAAYQTGVQVFWRQVSELAVGHHVAPDALATLAQAVFYFVDRLSTLSAHGYLQEQAESGITRVRRREELGQLLLSDRAQPGAVRSAAERAGWSLPSRAAVVLLTDADARHGDRAISRLDATCLPLRRPGMTGIVVPDPDRPGWRDRLAAALRGAGAVIGPGVPLDQLPGSVRTTRLGVELVQAGVLRDDPLFVDEHLDTLIVHQDPGLLEALRLRELRPLASCAPATRARLLQTLTAWIRQMGNQQAVAADLHVHPQTVRYRLGRLKELFGDDLNDPAVRARLHLVLLWTGAPAAPPDEDEVAPVAAVRAIR